MSDPAIQIENLGKSYRIGLQGPRANSFQDLVRNTLSAPLRRYQQLREKATEEDEFWAVRDLSFEVNRGEVLGIVGRNGAGKSTLLKLLSRITEPTEGKVVYRGRVASLLEVGTGFHPELSGRENIYLNGSILGMSKSEITAKFDEIVEFAEVNKFLDTPVKRYSSGMYVRLAFAVAAHLEPEILVVDEVLAVGDVAFQRKCLGKMQDVASGEGRTVLFVSHQMPSVRQLCQRAVFLEGGRMRSIGQADHVVDEYLASAAEHDQQVYDVSDKPVHRLATGQVKIGKLWFEPEGVKRYFGEDPIHFNVTVRGRETIERFRITCVIHSVQGYQLGSSWGESELSIRRGEDKTFRVSLPPMNLAPGPYHIQVMVGRGDPLTGPREMDDVNEVLHFEVMPTPVGGGAVEHWNDSYGQMKLPRLEAREIGPSSVPASV